MARWAEGGAGRPGRSRETREISKDVKNSRSNSYVTLGYIFTCFNLI
jgi:hypothetical protein